MIKVQIREGSVDVGSVVLTHESEDLLVVSMELLQKHCRITGYGGNREDELSVFLCRQCRGDHGPDTEVVFTNLPFSQGLVVTGGVSRYQCVVTLVKTEPLNDHPENVLYCREEQLT